ncbi:MAG TPA: chemotaxis protein CheW [Roseomonas sp.]|nr:chemotaxis protein CheW [Roseomonas sp.]
MLFLLFHLDDDPYVLEASRVSEVLPLVRVKAVPGTSRGGFGIINHRGAPVPVLDLSDLVLGRPARRQLSTRIVLIRRQAMKGEPQWLGLVLEQATETLRLDPASFVSPGHRNGAVPYLGPVLAHPRGLIHWVDPDRLLAHAEGGALARDLAGSA